GGALTHARRRSLMGFNHEYGRSVRGRHARRLGGGNKDSGQGSRASETVLFREAWPGARRKKIRRAFVPLSQWVLRVVRVCGSGILPPYTDGLGGGRYRGHCRGAQVTRRRL